MKCDVDYARTNKDQTILKMIAVDSIRQYADQPRKYIDQNFINELARTTSNIAQTTPISVRPLEPPVDGYSYEIIDGEQRWRACKLAGLTTIPAIIIPVKNESEQFLLSVISNVQRSTLTPIELARAIDRLLSMDMSQRQIGKMFGKSQCWVQIRHCLLSLVPEVQILTGPDTPEEKRISIMHANLLVGLPETTQVFIAQKMSELQLSMADARQLVAEKIRSDNIGLPQKNTSRLRLIENVTIFRNFAERTDTYLENFLSMENKKFQDLFSGENVMTVIDLRTAAGRISEKFGLLEECLQKIEASMLSKSLEVGHVSSPDVAKQKSDASGVNKEHNGAMQLKGPPRKWKTTKLLQIFGVPRKMLYGPIKNGKRRSVTHNSLWERSVDHLAILEMVKKSHRSMILVAHPDKRSNGDSDYLEAAMLNQAWETLQERFKRHGFVLE